MIVIGLISLLSLLSSSHAQPTGMGTPPQPMTPAAPVAPAAPTVPGAGVVDVNTLGVNGLGLNGLGGLGGFNTLGLNGVGVNTIGLNGLNTIGGVNTLGGLNTLGGATLKTAQLGGLNTLGLNTAQLGGINTLGLNTAQLGGINTLGAINTAALGAGIPLTAQGINYGGLAGNNVGLLGTGGLNGLNVVGLGGNNLGVLGNGLTTAGLAGNTLGGYQILGQNPNLAGLGGPNLQLINPAVTVGGAAAAPTYTLYDPYAVNMATAATPTTTSTYTPPPNTRVVRTVTIDPSGTSTTELPTQYIDLPTTTDMQPTTTTGPQPRRRRARTPPPATRTTARTTPRQVQQVQAPASTDPIAMPAKIEAASVISPSAPQTRAGRSSTPPQTSTPSKREQSQPHPLSTSPLCPALSLTSSVLMVQPGTSSNGGSIYKIMVTTDKPANFIDVHVLKNSAETMMTQGENPVWTLNMRMTPQETSPTLLQMNSSNRRLLQTTESTSTSFESYLPTMPLADGDTLVYMMTYGITQSDGTSIACDSDIRMFTPGDQVAPTHLIEQPSSSSRSTIMPGSTTPVCPSITYTPEFHQLISSQHTSIDSNKYYALVFKVGDGQAKVKWVDAHIGINADPTRKPNNWATSNFRLIPTSTTTFSHPIPITMNPSDSLTYQFTYSAAGVQCDSHVITMSGAELMQAARVDVA